MKRIAMNANGEGSRTLRRLPGLEVGVRWEGMGWGGSPTSPRMWEMLENPEFVGWS